MNSPTKPDVSVSERRSNNSIDASLTDEFCRSPTTPSSDLTNNAGNQKRTRHQEVTGDALERSKLDSIERNTSRGKGCKRKNGYIAFSRGQIIPQQTLDWIIDAARRGKITAAGKKLMLIPDTRHGPADASGSREMGRVRKSDCIPLTSLCPLGKRTTPTRSVAAFRTENIEKFDLKPTAGAASRPPKSHSGPVPLTGAFPPIPEAHRNGH